MSRFCLAATMLITVRKNGTEVIVGLLQTMCQCGMLETDSSTYVSVTVVPLAVVVAVVVTVEVVVIVEVACTIVLIYVGAL